MVRKGKGWKGEGLKRKTNNGKGWKRKVKKGKRMEYTVRNAILQIFNMIIFQANITSI